MNRITQLAIITTVLLSTVSCNEEIVTDYSEAGSNITVTLQVKSETKAGYEGTSVLPERFIIDIDQNGNDNDYPQTLMKKSEGTTYIPEQNITMTWKDTDHSNVTIKAITSPDGRYDISSGLMTIEEDQSTPNKLKVNDLLGASTANGITIGGNNINVAFNHLMSKLYVTYTKSASVTINSIKLRNVCTAGTYNYATLSYGNATLPSANDTPITMYHNEGTAEAIFFPFEPQTDPELVVNVTISGSGSIDSRTTDISCPVSLKNAGGFIGGKIYLMNIEIIGTSVNNAGITIEPWGGDIQVPGERVLWIGTSIPSGHPGLYTSYPELVDEAMNCTVINNALPSSFVIPQKNADWTGGNWDASDSNWPLLAGGLSQTYLEVEAKYLSLLNNKYGEGNPVVTQELNKIKAYSYMSLIIPYINGEKDNCTTVIIDHGFNDRDAMFYEAGGLSLDKYTSTPQHVRGYNYLMGLKNKEILYDTPTPNDSEIDYLDFLNEKSHLTLLGNYIVEMSKVIKAIKDENPNVRIIIGNYFTLNNPEITIPLKNRHETGSPETNPEFGAFPDYMYFTYLISYYNEAVAGIWDLDIVNVQNYIWMDDAGFYEFCPDKTHPWGNPNSIRAIADVYIRELDGVIGSRIN